MRERATMQVRWVGALLVGLLLVLPALAQREQVQRAGTFDLKPLVRRGAMPEILPFVAGDMVLVSSTLRLFAFDAPSGREVWSSEQPTGWGALAKDERLQLEETIDRERLLVAPAAGELVALAALQLPLSRSPYGHWQGIPVSVALPERRLFAFELASGRPLWNHAPPAGWDGTSGTLPQRMRVCGAPLVVGSRVLVPCTYDASSIDYHVLCCALDTGELLWSTFVMRGQTERNMWGVQCVEFAVAPLVVTPDGGSVLAQTGLGQICALDPRDGCILWTTRYPAIALPKTKSYAFIRRPTVWRTTPPVVADGIVFATPGDSDTLVALDLASGVLLWSLPHVTVRELVPQEGFALDQLVGVAHGLVFLGGAGLVALERTEGPGGEESWLERWSRPCARSSARAWLAGDRLFVPDAGRILELDARTGEELRTHASGPLFGLAVTEGTLFALSETALLPLAR